MAVWCGAGRWNDFLKLHECAHQLALYKRENASFVSNYQSFSRSAHSWQDIHDTFHRNQALECQFSAIPVTFLFWHDPDTGFETLTLRKIVLICQTTSERMAVLSLPQVSSAMNTTRTLPTYMRIVSESSFDFKQYSRGF